MKTVEWLRSLAAPRPRPWGGDCPHGTPVPLHEPCPDCDAVALTELAEGDSARVSCLQHPDQPAAVRLAGAGILPGAEVQLMQRWPTFVIRLGYAELAVDRETAGIIRVRPSGPNGSD
jgi:Fe2+ transport system protein FeoA